MSNHIMEPVAIVGIGCKVPGADNLEQYWRVLEQGENHVVEIPKERWNNDAFYSPDKHALGQTYVRKAGLLKDPLAFDNRVFNINDFEADQMDPQQRMVLECTHMAMEDGGFTRDRLAGSNTGVYVGAMNADYRGLFICKSQMVGNYTVTGVSNGIIAARVSFTFDLRGPSMTIDTACSSALLAIHLGIQALRTGDCDLALCGGVNFLLLPDVFVHLSKAQMVSPTGQCFAFSDQADGYTRGEGCGMVIVKRLKDALRDGDKIWATIDSASNQDGRTVTPISAPSGEQQTRLLEQIYGQASTSLLDSIDYIEAHGTGTAAGDPVEANALGMFFLNKGSSHHRYIGSVKTNIGHLESAAGTAGLIKVLLMMKHSRIVPTLFFQRSNPRIDFPGMNLTVPTQVIDWPAQNKIACVNSFGFGGTNCHALVRCCPESLARQDHPAGNSSLPCIVCFSGKNENSLRGSMVDFLQHPELSSLDVRDVAYTSTVRRDHFNIRHAVIANDVADVISRLNEFLHIGEKGSASTRKCRIVFIFGGMGTSWKGMCKEFLTISTGFRDVLLDIDRYLTEFVSWSLIDRLESETGIDDPEYSPIAIFACQIGLAKMWLSLGLEPSCLTGQSVGEVAAAYVAGILSMRDAVKVIYYRTWLMAQVAGGKMFVVRNMPIGLVKEVVLPFSGRANVSLEYSPISCAVSCDADAISRIKQDLLSKSRAHNLQIQLLDLQVPVAYHSHHVDRCRAGLGEALADITALSPRLDMVSSVTGELVVSPLGPDYWVSNMRDPVRFREAVSKTCAKGFTNVYVEIGPKPVLRAHLGDLFPKEDVIPVVSMTGTNEWRTFLQAVVSVYQLGIPIKWEGLPTQGSTITPVPRYCFNPRRNLQLCEAAAIYLGGLEVMRNVHPFVYKVANTDHFKILITSVTLPSLLDHVVSGVLIVPGALYAEAGLALIQQSYDMKAPRYGVSVTFEQPCSFSKETPLELSLEITTRADTSFNGDKRFDDYHVAVRKGDKTFAQIVLHACSSRASPSPVNIRYIQERCPRKVAKEEIYGALRQLGFSYGPCYSLLESAHASARECLTRLSVSSSLFPELAGTTIHPSILDCIFQTSVVLAEVGHDASDRLPRSVGRVTCFQPFEPDMYVYTVLKHTDHAVSIYDMKLTTLCGQIIAEIQELTIRSLTEKTTTRVDNIYSCIWQPVADARWLLEDKCPHPNNVLLITDASDALVQTHDCIRIDPGNDSGVALKEALDSRLKKLRDVYSLIILAVTDSSIDDEEDADRVMNKTLNLCLVLKKVLTYANTRQLTLPFYLITRRAFPQNGESPEKEEVINPVMAALWGVARCAMKEHVYTDLLLVDLHIPRQACTLSNVASVAQQIEKTRVSHDYPEWLVTEQKLAVNLIVRVDADTPIPTFRNNVADPSQSVILLSKEPTAPTDVFYVQHDFGIEHDVVKSQYTRLTASCTAFQNPLLFNMSLLYSCMEQTRPSKGDGFPLFALERVGLARDGDENEVVTSTRFVSCYPCPIGSKVHVPRASLVPANLMPDYAPGDLTRLIVLWSLCAMVKEQQQVTILTSCATAELGQALSLLLTAKKKKYKIGPVRCVRLEDMKQTVTLEGVVISMILLEETVVPLLTQKGSKMQKVITLENMYKPSARDRMTLSSPHVEIQVLDTAQAFLPHKLLPVIQEVKEWAQKQPSLVKMVVGHIHNNKLDNSETLFADVASDLLELLQTKVFFTAHSMVRVNRDELFRRDAFYLVVGGLSGLGWIFVHFLAKCGAGGVAILNRRRADAAQQKEMSSLAESTHCTIKAFQVDVTQANSLKTCLLEMNAQFPNLVLKGIFFGAAVVRDQLLLQSDDDTFSKVLSPKVMGAWNLHQLTKDVPLDYFVLHSSITSVFGNAGQANYAAGNAFMDGLAFYRRSLHLPGQTINWGALDLGILQDRSDAKKIFEAGGFRVFKGEEVEGLIASLLLFNWPQNVVTKLDKEVFTKKVNRDGSMRAQNRVKALLDATIEEVKIEQDVLTALQSAIDVSEDQRLVIYERYVMALISQALGIEDASVNPDSNLMDLGMDSLTAMTVIGQIYKELHCRLPAIVFISGEPTAQTIARAIDDAKKSQAELVDGSIELRDVRANKSVGDKSDMMITLEGVAKDNFNNTVSMIEHGHLVTYKNHNHRRQSHAIVVLDVYGKKNNPDRVRETLLSLLETHPIARTAFEESSNKTNNTVSYEKKILPAEKSLDLRISRVGSHQVDEWYEEVFDLTQKGPVRFILEAGARTRLKVIFHKVGFDSHAMNQFIQDLVAAHNTSMHQERSDNMDVSKVYAAAQDINSQLEVIYKQKADEAREFWKRVLYQDVNAASFWQRKLNHGRNEQATGTIKVIRTVLSPKLAHKVVRFISRHGVSLLALVSSIYQLLVHLITGASVVSLVFPLNLRRYLGNSRDVTLVNYSNEIPLVARINSDRTTSVQEFVTNNNTFIQQCINNGRVPFTCFEDLAKRATEIFLASPHGINIEMLSAQEERRASSRSSLNSCPVALPLGLETNIFIQHSLKKEIIVLSFQYREAVLNETSAQLLVSNLTSLLAGTVSSSELSFGRVHKFTRAIQKNGGRISRP